MLVNSYIVPFSYLLGDDLIEHKASDKTMPVATIFFREPPAFCLVDASKRHSFTREYP